MLHFRLDEVLNLIVSALIPNCDRPSPLKERGKSNCDRYIKTLSYNIYIHIYIYSICIYINTNAC